MRPPAPPVLQLTDLRVFRGRTTLLRDVSWTVEPGQHWVLLGANGSGKTSLLAALTGYLTPSAGRIELLGHRYGHADWPALRRRVGFVSSALRQLFHEDEPAIEIVIGGRYAAIDIRSRPKPADLRLARALLRQIGAAGLALRPWAVLSQGERQRVLIARALMARPDLLILDEPCAGLDPVARERFLGFLARLAASPRPALVLVTHHVEEIVPGFEHTLVLRAGRVAASGPTRRIVTSRVLSEAFEAPVRIGRRHGRYGLRLEADTLRR
jgi:iron complex transport system ATP-binding protein